MEEISSKRNEEISYKKLESVKVQKLREVAAASYRPPFDPSIPITVPVDLDSAVRNNDLAAFATDSQTKQLTEAEVKEPVRLIDSAAIITDEDIFINRGGRTGSVKCIDNCGNCLTSTSCI